MTFCPSPTVSIIRYALKITHSISYQLTWREIQVDLGFSVAVVGLGSRVAPAALERLEVLPPPGPTRVLRQPLLLGAPKTNTYMSKKSNDRLRDCNLQCGITQPILGLFF